MTTYKSENNLFIAKILFLPFILIFVINQQVFSQKITGLSGWNICLDPGHSQTENMGIYNYSEAEKNLGVALELRQMLLDWTDIDTVYLTRTNSVDIVDLSQRSIYANSVGAAHFHSIHSDASAMGSPDNSTLIMWGQLGIDGPEKTPYGGKKMSEIMIGLLTAGMRTDTRGAMGDRDFYQTPGSLPYLSVNRNTAMASELSEAGFHTNPIQNQLNMNEKWKRLEAKTMFWTILEYHNIKRPFVGTVAGIIKDIDTGLPINGAIATINGQADTTDTWESLFYKYSTDPNQLRNGFYYLEGIPAGTQQLIITADGYDTLITDIAISDTFFTFKDVNLVSSVPFTVTATDPVENDSLYPGKKNITINFSKPVNTTIADTSIIITPNVSVDFVWSSGNKTLTINSTNFVFDTLYNITIRGNCEDIYGHLLDGNGDGTGGDDFSLNIRTKVQDIIPPHIVDVYPPSNSVDVELKPIISITFDELLNTKTITNGIKIIRNSTQSVVTPTLRAQYAINGRTVVNYFTRASLPESESFTIQLLPSLQDEFGNNLENEIDYEFTTGNSDYILQSSIDNFDSGIANWNQPEASDNTIGVLPLLTNLSSVSSIYNLSTSGNLKSAMFDYAYDENASNWFIREFRNTESPTFNNDGFLQSYVFGDGNNNQMRFVLKESDTNTFEVSPWYNINWIGWRLVSWNLSEGQTGTWLGNGILEPPLIFDSFQFTYLPGNLSQGTYYFDDLRIAAFTPTDVQQTNNKIPASFALEQNYPNPFNPSTQIKFSIAKESNVKLIINDILGREVETLVNDNLSAGNYSIIFDGKNISSGVYFYTLIADNFKQSHKMILMK